jgi:hypothetical protein
MKITAGIIPATATKTPKTKPASASKYIKKRPTGGGITVVHNKNAGVKSAQKSHSIKDMLLSKKDEDIISQRHVEVDDD